MKKTIAILLLVSIVLTGLLVAFITGFYAKYSIERTIEDSIAELHGNLQPVFVAFDSLIEREERAVRQKMAEELPRIHEEVMALGRPFADIPPEELARIVRRHGFTEGYLIDAAGMIVTTTFTPDQGFNLHNISPEFSAWLSSIYDAGKVVTDRLVLSTKTGILNVYGYYSPPGRGTITEVSMNIRRYIEDNSGSDYVNFLFRTLFEKVMQSNAKVTDVDLFMYNDLAAWSILREGVALDEDIRRKLRQEHEVRIQLGDKLIVYTRVQPVAKKEMFIQDFCTKVAYDISDMNAIMRDFIVYTVLSMLLIVPFVYVLVSRAVTRRVIAPIDAVVATLDGIGKGDYSRDLKVRSVPEIETIAAAVNAMRLEIVGREKALEEHKAELERRVAERTRELERAHREAEALARTDTLTGLPNRRHFYEMGEAVFANAKRYDHPVSAIMLDLDHFKRINDTYGHGFGDKVLVVVADVLLRDKREVDLCGRLGGEEFAMILPDTGVADATVFAERLRIRLAEIRIPHDDGSIALTCSLGIAERGKECESLDALLARADIALYRAKRLGRDRVEVNRGESAEGED